MADHRTAIPTPDEALERRIMDSNVPKTESEWWAAHRIAALEHERDRLIDQGARYMMAQVRYFHQREHPEEGIQLEYEKVIFELTKPNGYASQEPEGELFAKRITAIMRGEA